MADAKTWPRDAWAGYVEPTFGQRLIARFLDWAPFAVLGAISQFVIGWKPGFVGFALATAYEVGFIAARGQTPGKMFMDIRVVRFESGEPPRLWQAFVRWLVFDLASLVDWAIPGTPTYLVGGYGIVLLVMVIMRPYHRGPHDLAARTVVTANPVTAGREPLPWRRSAR